jgi:hypothetical protein
MTIIGAILRALSPWPKRPTASGRKLRTVSKGWHQRDTFELIFNYLKSLPPSHTANIVEMCNRLANDSHRAHALQQRVRMLLLSGLLGQKRAKPHTRVYLKTTLTLDEAYEYHKAWYAEFKKPKT